MEGAAIIFFIILLILFYTYLGYPLLIGICVLLQRLMRRSHPTAIAFTEPELTLIIPCYNEADILEKKIANCFRLDYPPEKIRFLFITDGSTDHSADILSAYPQLIHLHHPERKGKTAAINRAMQFADTPFVFFTDANALLNSASIRTMMRHFAEEKTGCVSGEKKMITNSIPGAADTGETLYWKYESRLKQLDTAFNSTIGAIGELMVIRTRLYRPLPEDCLLDDFTQSMQIAASGYRIAYEPGAYALETASANIGEEWKRKLRIATGNWQALFRLRHILSWKRTPLLCFQYLTHRWLKRAVAPFLLLLFFFSNGLLVFSGHTLYALFFLLQVIFYLLAFTGHLFRKKTTRIPFFFAPYYFCLMHYAALAGWMRYLKGMENGVWEKAERKSG